MIIFIENRIKMHRKIMGFLVSRIYKLVGGYTVKGWQIAPGVLNLFGQAKSGWNPTGHFSDVGKKKKK